jgi:urea transporter
MTNKIKKITKEFIRTFLVVASGGMMLALALLTACSVLFGETSSINWGFFAQSIGLCAIGLGIAYLMRDKHEKHPK